MRSMVANKLAHFLRFFSCIVSIPLVFLYRLCGEIYSRKLEVEDGFTQDRSSGGSEKSTLYQCRKKMIIDALKPTQFLKHWSSEPQTLRPTAWLDGLRGSAALVVAIYHFAHFWPWATQGYATSESNYHWLQLPFVRLVISGDFSVRIFFVISGFVLSQKSIQLARERQFTRLFENLTSSAFRRWTRLTLPSAISQVIEFLILSSFSQSHRQSKTFSSHLWSIFSDVWGLANPFRTGKFRPQYNAVLWTIPAEMQGSIFVYIFLLALSRVRPYVRMAVLFGAAIQCAFTSERLLSLFLVGIIMAELDLIFKDQKPTSQTIGEFFKTINPYLFAVGLHLGLHPQKRMDLSPGWISISYFLMNYLHMPSWAAEEACYSVGAVFVCAAINYSLLLQRPFNSRFCQYLGDISFSLYLLHSWFIFFVGKPLLNQILKILYYDSASPTIQTAVFSFAITLVFIPVWLGIFWASDLFTRLVDVRCVKLAKEMESLAFVGKESEMPVRRPNVTNKISSGGATVLGVQEGSDGIVDSARVLVGRDMMPAGHIRARAERTGQQAEQRWWR